MARKRMISLDVANSDQYLEMPATTSNLYTRLNLNADDDGFVGNKMLAMAMAKASEDDLKILLAKNYVIIFPSGVLVIVHWKIHNTIQKDRYKETLYLKEKNQLAVTENGMYTFCIQDGNTDKVSIGKLNNNSNNNISDGKIQIEDRKLVEGPLAEDPFEDEDPLQLKDKNIYSIIESNFGRTLSGMEYEVITDWIEKSKYSEELILLAVKEAVIKNTRSIKYIDRILYSWHLKGIKTVPDAEKQMKEFNSSKENKTFNNQRSRKSNNEVALDNLEKKLEGDKNAKN
jgi:DnaD/phage-associated family protein